MKRRFEQFRVRYADLRRSESRELVGGRDFRFDFRAIIDALRLPLSPRMVDLLRVASSVYFIDRLVKRDRRNGPNSWPRTIECSVEVREPEFWENSSVHELLDEAVGFVSGDRWTFSFMRDRTAPKLPNETLFKAEFFDVSPVISLYSGGLDSAGGLASRLADRAARPLIPVIVRHRTDITGRASGQLQHLAKQFGVQLVPVTTVVSAVRPKRLVGHEELSQRARAFLFLAVAGVVAGATRSPQVEVYESGLGALNVPLLAGTEGSQATRGAHPTFLKLMSRLLSFVCGYPIAAILPFMNRTKGEVVKSLRADSLERIAKSTISCAHFPVRLEKGTRCKSCGICPACIFRRLALHAAGIGEDPGAYQHDILNPSSCRIGPKKLRYLMAYLLQVDSLAELDQNRLPLIIARHLQSTGVLVPGDSQQPYVDLFRRYRTEWYGLLGAARSNGCDWARRIDLSGQAA